MSAVPAAVVVRMIVAAEGAIGPGPSIVVDSFGRLKLKWDRPNPIRIFEAMDAARVAAPDGYTNAELISVQLAEALQARGYDSLDGLLAMFDTAYPNAAPRGEGACMGCGASAGDPVHSVECPFHPDNLPANTPQKVGRGKRRKPQ